MEFLKREVKGQIHELSATYNITGILPLFVNESLNNQLIVITDHGVRIFIKFSEEERP
jgi:hypothetical protein